MSNNFWGRVKQLGVLPQAYPFAGTAWFVAADDGASGSPPRFGKQADSLSELFRIASPGDVAYLGPGRFTEKDLVIPATLDNFTLVGTGGRGAAFIEPSGTNDKGLEVLGRDVTLINVGVAGKGTALYALQVGDETRRFRAYGCKIEGPTNVACRIVGTGDALFEDCEFAWCGVGVDFVGGLSSFPTQVFIKNSFFHNIVTAHVRGSGANGKVVNLNLWDNYHDNDESAVEPTDFLLIDATGNTGLVSGCRFAIATNLAAKLTIATGVKWAANATEAGWSTARPA